MPAYRTAKITWGAGFTGSIIVGYPLDNAVAYTKDREGSQYEQAPSGIEDAWVVGEDNYLEGYVRWIPRHNTVTPVATGWETTPTSSVNLVRNGDFEAGQVNWTLSSSLYVVSASDATSPVGGNYVLQCSSNYIRAEADEFIPVDVTVPYSMSCWVRQAAATDGVQYLGISCHDANFQHIFPHNVWAPQGLAATGSVKYAVSESATSIALLSAVNFPDEASGSSNTFAQFNAQDDGSDLPNQLSFRYLAVSGSVLHLAAPLPTGVGLSVGAKVRFSRSTGNYNYTMLAGVATTSIPSAWTQYSSSMSGETALGGITDTYKFTYGTKYIRPFFYNNGGVGYNVMRYDDFRFWAVPPAGGGWQKFLAWARAKNQFRFYPDATKADYITSYLVEPLNTAPTLEPDGTRSLKLTIRSISGSFLGY